MDFLRYKMKCSGENETLRRLFHVVSRFPLHTTVQVISRKFGLLFWTVYVIVYPLQHIGTPLEDSALITAADTLQ